jgi:hypothetical protein
LACGLAHPAQEQQVCAADRAESSDNPFISLE